MNKPHLALAVCLMGISILYIAETSAQTSGIIWQNTIGGTGDDKLWRISPTSDGNIFCSGFSKSPNGGDKTENVIGAGYMDFWVMKLDTLGNIIWQNTIGGTKDDYCLDAQPTSDGGYILCGHSNSLASGDKTESVVGFFGWNDYWIVKLNSVGNIVWQNDIGGTYLDYGKAIRETSDGGFIVAGQSSSGISYDKTVDLHGTPSGNYDAWILKLDATGNIIWQKDYGGTGNEYVSDIIQTTDGGYLLGVESTSGASGDKSEALMGTSDNWIVKLDASGNIEWENTIGGDGIDQVGRVVQTSDGNYVVAGNSSSGISGDKTEASNINNDYWIYKLDLSGNIIWQNTIGGSGSEFLYGMTTTPDNGVVIIGESNSGMSGDKDEFSVGNTDYWMIKINASGGFCWQETIGGTMQDVGRGIYETSPGKYIVGGYSYSNLSGDKTENNVSGTSYPDFWVMKVQSDITPGVEICNGYDDDCDGLVDESIVETISIIAGGATTFCQGSSVILTATYSGTSVQWKKNGVNISGATAATYSANASGTYSCVTSSACASATSGDIVVTVNKNPSASISAGGPTSFCAGGSVVLTENPIGGGAYQWFKGAAMIPGATTTSYTATTTGNYKCRVTKIATGCLKNSNTIAVLVTCKEGEEFVSSNFEIYPNPANNFISVETNVTGNKEIELMDATGNIISVVESTENNITLTIDQIPAGVYFIRMRSGNSVSAQIFTKQ